MAVAVCTTFSIQIHGFPDLLVIADGLPEGYSDSSCRNPVVLPSRRMTERLVGSGELPVVQHTTLFP